jgi:hypothetical protein
MRCVQVQEGDNGGGREVGRVTKEVLMRSL